MSAERQEIVEAINTTPNLAAAARKLNVARKTLFNRMKFYSLPAGKSGRPKHKVGYRKRRALYTAGALAAGALIGVAVFKQGST
jgi:hypothetical protein